MFAGEQRAFQDGRYILEPKGPAQAALHAVGRADSRIASGGARFVTHAREKFARNGVGALGLVEHLLRFLALALGGLLNPRRFLPAIAAATLAFSRTESACMADGASPNALAWISRGLASLPVIDTG